MMLAVGDLLEAVLYDGSAPPNNPACQGCKSKVRLRQPTADLDLEPAGRDEARRAAQELSIYSFEMRGTCEFLKQRSAKDEL